MTIIMNTSKNRIAANLKAFVAGLGSIILAATFAVPMRSAPSNAEAAAPSFDLVSVKRSGSLMDGQPVRPDRYDQRDGRFTCNESLVLIVQEAFRVKTGEFSAPEWMITEKYEIQALAGRGVSYDTVRLMLQTMLAQRLGFKYHWEDKPRDIYALVSGKHKLRLVAAAPPAHDNAAVSAAQKPRGVGTGVFEGTATMDDFAAFLSNAMDRKVVNMTGDATHYAFNIDWRKDLQAIDPPEKAGDVPDLREARHEVYLRSVAGLGLRLEPRKAPMKYLVVDHANTQPTPN